MSKLLLASGSEGPNKDTLAFVSYLAGAGEKEDIGCNRVPIKGDVVLNTSQKRVDARIRNSYDADSCHEVNGMTDGDLDELLEACRYVDAVIVEAGFTFGAESLGPHPTLHLMQLLQKAECPVIIAPPLFEQIDQIVFAYDGCRSSIYAMREFIYVFPEFRNKPVKVLEIREDIADMVHEQHRLRGWLGNHFANIDFVHLEGQAESGLLVYLLRCRNAFVVAGGMGRSFLSTLLRPSTTAALVRELAAPMFIAHH